VVTVIIEGFAAVKFHLWAVTLHTEWTRSRRAYSTNDKTASSLVLWPTWLLHIQWPTLPPSSSGIKLFLWVQECPVANKNLR